jgi:flagellar biosynthesis/type III secretory pathway chaperone
MITYDKRAGQFRGSDGKFVKRASVLREIELSKKSLRERLDFLTQQLVNRKISLSEWQNRSMDVIKYANLRMMALASGGKRNLTNAHYGRLGAKLKPEWQRLKTFAEEIRSGNLTEKQIIARSRLYAQSASTAFYNAELLSKGLEGFKYAKRWLDVGAKHCTQCPNYSTNGLWVSLEQVILPGHECNCRGNCKCQISYKK